MDTDHSLFIFILIPWRSFVKYLSRGVPSIRYRHCIRCYCCQELCPQGAVEVAYPWIRRVMGGG
jgi:ferredoxin